MAFAPASFSFLSSYYLQPLILFIFYINLICFQHVRAASNETDYLALLKFKESITDDPHDILSSWNSSNHFCSWIGITCGHKHQRVTKLNLGGYQFGGIISHHIGEIPWNLTSCTKLRILDLAGNRLIGKIPYQLGYLQKLEHFQLSLNNLTGEIPWSIWNLTSLTRLAVGCNNLEASIPEEIGRLKNLMFLGAPRTTFSGALPSALFNLSSLTILSVAENDLNMTQLPHDMFSTLPNLEYFSIGGNQISGPIPNSIKNASSLQRCDISSNHFFGQVPNLGNLKDLSRLNIQINNFGSSSNGDLDFMTPLKNCSKLQILSLGINKFGGILPNSIGNLSTQLSGLYLRGNEIYGTIPDTLGKYKYLTVLALESNRFSGAIPISFGNLREIKELGLDGNQLSGEIPGSLGNLSELILLSISGNMLQGKVPITMGNMKSLLTLDLSENNLSGPIPFEIFGLPSLSILLNLSHNSFNGSLPSEVGMLKNLGTLDISENNLSGEIPWTIGECTSMEYLNLKGNSFNGPMPPSLALMKGLVHLDISQNNLSGSILIDLQNVSFLQYLNISFNTFDGEVPVEGVFSNASAISLIGNINLCGGIYELHLPPCPKKVDTKRKHNLKLMAIVICVAFSLLLIFLFAFYWKHERNKKSSSTSSRVEQFPKVSYQNLHIVTQGFSTNNLIGSGSSGSVYKGRLESEDKIVAIKVLNFQKKRAQKSFISECNALKNMRHRNLVKILTCCSSIDYNGQEFKALVFEYMPNGSLEKWLHPNQESACQSALDIYQRFNVVYDVASALHYLHYENEEQVVHCDIKPSNVLLDDDMVAHVSDFGLARLLATLKGSSQKQTSTSGIKGTIGYAPPEYGITSEVSTHGDVYSFGILILEMLTGKRPTNLMFEDGHNLHSYVKAAFPDNLLEIMDTALVRQQVQQTTIVARGEIRMEEVALMHPNHEKTLISLFKIGLACSVESPKERMDTMSVLRELNQIKNAL
ncbi:probable LRR receptor-like serine/threonine-protein kinase At3g47570, partial [Neltuma alba]|uniref:probable LRR receptor-like serine/threonine-protein kinase At3g47570 n=1 Tax=Neltuma alba TaxID=207710 RepID=UPI0010A35FE5